MIQNWDICINMFLEAEVSRPSIISFNWQHISVCEKTENGKLIVTVMCDRYIQWIQFSARGICVQGSPLFAITKAKFHQGRQAAARSSNL